jgi:hypothetical protein
VLTRKTGGQALYFTFLRMKAQGSTEKQGALTFLVRGVLLVVCCWAANMALNRSAVIMRFYFFSFPCRARLALRYELDTESTMRCSKWLNY